MSSNHYKKYKDTIKEVTKRNYHKRVSSLNEYLENTKCIHCGENEIACLRFYPHDKEIRKTIKRVGMNEKSRKQVKKLIDSSKIIFRVFDRFSIFSGEMWTSLDKMGRTYNYPLLFIIICEVYFI